MLLWILLSSLTYLSTYLLLSSRNNTMSNISQAGSSNRRSATPSNGSKPPSRTTSQSPAPPPRGASPAVSLKSIAPAEEDEPEPESKPRVLSKTMDGPRWGKWRMINKWNCGCWDPRFWDFWGKKWKWDEEHGDPILRWYTYVSLC